MSQTPTIYLLFLLVLMVCGVVHGKNQMDEPYLYDEAVSLGNVCQVAQQLNENGIRHKAYPFDWIISPTEGLLHFIHSKGEKFLDMNNIQVGGAWQQTHFLISIDTQYHFQFLHDFYTPFESSYPVVKQKYDRRKERFFNLLQSNKRVLFVRMNIAREQAELLDYMLHTTYPNLTYTILAVNGDPQVDWGLERVKNVYLAQIPDVWYGDQMKWKEILTPFPVKPTRTPPPSMWAYTLLLEEITPFNILPLKSINIIPLK